MAEGLRSSFSLHVEYRAGCVSGTFEAASTVLRDLDFRIVLEADSAPQNGGKSAILAG